jgi:hypothetical protein
MANPASRLPGAPGPYRGIELPHDCRGSDFDRVATDGAFRPDRFKFALERRTALRSKLARRDELAPGLKNDGSFRDLLSAIVSARHCVAGLMGEPLHDFLREQAVAVPGEGRGVETILVDRQPDEPAKQKV